MIPGIIAQMMRLVGTAPAALNNYLLYGWGWDYYSEMMGLGAIAEPVDEALDVPTQLDANNWHMVSGGNNFAVGIKSDGTLWGWGRNDSGQLGLGQGSSSIPHATPQQIGTASNWKYVSCGTYQIFAINTNGDMYAWGLEQYGERGLGFDVNNWSYDIYEPTLVTISGTNDWDTADPPSYIPGTGTSSGPWKQVACGCFHTIALKEDGTMWATGLVGAGQTGTTVDGGGDNLGEFVQIGADSDWSFIAAGRDHSFGIKNNGTLWGWGAGTAGQLGTGSNANVYQPTQIGSMTWKSVSGGSFSSVGVTTDGKLWAWGNNDYLQLGGAGPSVNVPTQVGTDTDWDMVVSSGRQTDGLYDEAHFAIKVDGSLYSWGNDGYSGQLGRDLGVDSSSTDPYPIGQVAGTQWKILGTGYGIVFGLKGVPLVPETVLLLENFDGTGTLVGKTPDVSPAGAWTSYSNFYGTLSGGFFIPSELGGYVRGELEQTVSSLSVPAGFRIEVAFRTPTLRLDTAYNYQNQITFSLWGPTAYLDVALQFYNVGYATPGIVFEFDSGAMGPPPNDPLVGISSDFIVSTPLSLDPSTVYTMAVQVEANGRVKLMINDVAYFDDIGNQPMVDQLLTGLFSGFMFWNSAGQLTAGGTASAGSIDTIRLIALGS